MATTNYERVGAALELLKDGLLPFIQREMQARYGKYWITDATSGWRNELVWPEGQDLPILDAAALLRLMWDQWNEVFRRTLGFAERSIVSELREVRNKWAHQNPFSTDDTYRALDSTARLLTAISAPQADEIEKMKTELLRLRFEEQLRTERRRSAGTAVESQATGSLKPWREVLAPHMDVANGSYQQAEFAADLWQVHLREGAPEYRDAVEFFRRTYLTDGLKRLLTGAVQRLAENRADPVVQLQTNFGGGKTHSMLALYHLFSGSAPSELAGVEALMAQAGVSHLPNVRRVVLVGNKLSPGNPSTKADGTKVRTLWGELAWQLGDAAGGPKEARRAYERVQADDELATSPGDTLRELFNDYGPCLILVDEWVAYARQLHDRGDLPGGDFETHFTFAQALTESAKAARNCLLVVSLPASDTTGSPHAVADDVEVGGERGRAALERLRNAVGRVETPWRPASAEEGFEIVRRRLFEPLVERAQFVARDSVARSFAEMYRTQAQEFPPEARDADYEGRIKAAYPIHPEVFDRLYNDWSTLVKFQRTRGVLRLMAAVINSLWEKGDRNPLIMPANIPIDDPRVQFELTRYLSDNWVPVIEKDVDGPSALPLRIDGEVPNLGKYAASRRVARTIYLGSAPTVTAAHHGIEDRQVRLGCMMPTEPAAVFGDALRRLATAATYLYQDGPRYWYSTQPTVTKLAEDRAEQLKRDPDKVTAEIEKRLRTDLSKKGDFPRVHALPHSGQDVPEGLDARLVVLGPEHPYFREAGNKAEAAAKAILEWHGSSPRRYRNTVVFLAPDHARLQDLDQAVRSYLAWESILADKDTLDLTPNQVKQAETQRNGADTTVKVRLPETYQWLLVPVQQERDPKAPITWQAIRLSGQDDLAVRASKKLRSDELLVTSFAATRLRMDLDRVPLWRGDNVSIKQLADDFAQYLYLPRLTAPDVLLKAIRDGIALLTWELDSFAYADSFDDAARRYRGLRAGEQVIVVDQDTPALLVKPDVARRQLDGEANPGGGAPGGGAGGGGTTGGSGGGTGPATGGNGGTTGGTGATQQPRRFHGSVVLDTARVGRDASRIAEEVIAHLAGLAGADVRVTLEIEADIPDGAPERVVRTVTENSRTLKFKDHGFEET